MFKLRKIILKPQKSFRQLTVPVPVYLSVCFFLRDSSYIILVMANFRLCFNRRISLDLVPYSDFVLGAKLYSVRNNDPCYRLNGLC